MRLLAVLDQMMSEAYWPVDSSTLQSINRTACYSHRLASKLKSLTHGATITPFSPAFFAPWSIWADLMLTQRSRCICCSTNLKNTHQLSGSWKNSRMALPWWRGGTFLPFSTLTTVLSLTIGTRDCFAALYCFVYARWLARAHSIVSWFFLRSSNIFSRRPLLQCVMSLDAWRQREARRNSMEWTLSVLCQSLTLCSRYDVPSK